MTESERNALIDNLLFATDANPMAMAGSTQPATSAPDTRSKPEPFTDDKRNALIDNLLFVDAPTTPIDTFGQPDAPADRQPLDFDFRSEFQGAAPASTTWRPAGNPAETVLQPTSDPFDFPPGDDVLGAEVKGYDLPTAPEMSTAERLWAGNRDYQPRDKGVRNKYFQGLSDEDYAKVFEAGRILAEAEPQQEDAEAFYHGLTKEERLALDHYKALPKGYAERNAAAFATGVGRSVPLSHLVAPETAAERKQQTENPLGAITGGFVGNVAGALTGGGAVAKGITSIPKVGAAIAKSPLLKTAVARTVTSGGMAGGQSVGRDDIKDVLINTAIGAGAGMVSVLPEVYFSAGATQLLVQPLTDLLYDASVGIARGEDITDRNWLINEFATLGVSGAFAIRDMKSGDVFRMDQAKQRGQVGRALGMKNEEKGGKGLKSRLRGWMYGREDSTFEIVDVKSLETRAEQDAKAGKGYWEKNKYFGVKDESGNERDWDEFTGKPEPEGEVAPQNAQNMQEKGGRIDDNGARAPEVPPEPESVNSGDFRGGTEKPETETKPAGEKRIESAEEHQHVNHLENDPEYRESHEAVRAEGEKHAREIKAAMEKADNELDPDVQAEADAIADPTERTGYIRGAVKSALAAEKKASHGAFVGYGLVSQAKQERIYRNLVDAKVPVIVETLDIGNQKGLNIHRENIHSRADMDMREVLGDVYFDAAREAGGIIARTGGDEYTILFPGHENTAKLETFRDIAEKRIRAKRDELGLGELHYAGDEKNPKLGSLHTVYGFAKGGKDVPYQTARALADDVAEVMKKKYFESRKNNSAKPEKKDNINNKGGSENVNRSKTQKAGDSVGRNGRRSDGNNLPKSDAGTPGGTRPVGGEVPPVRGGVQRQQEQGNAPSPTRVAKSGAAPADKAHAPDAVRYDKRTAKMFIIENGKTFGVMNDIDGHKYITNGHIVKPTTDAEIKSLSETLGVEPQLSNPVYEDSKPPQNNSLVKGILESIKGASAELGEPKAGTGEFRNESIALLVFDSPKGPVFVDKKNADLFNQQGNRFYAGGKYGPAETTVVVKSADGRLAGFIYPRNPDNIDVSGFKPVPNYFSHGEKPAGGDDDSPGGGKPAPQPTVESAQQALADARRVSAEATEKAKEAKAKYEGLKKAASNVANRTTSAKRARAARDKAKAAYDEAQATADTAKKEVQEAAKTLRAAKTAGDATKKEASAPRKIPAEGYTPEYHAKALAQDIKQAFAEAVGTGWRTDLQIITTGKSINSKNNLVGRPNISPKAQNALTDLADKYQKAWGEESESYNDPDNPFRRAGTTVPENGDDVRAFLADYYINKEAFDKYKRDYEKDYWANKDQSAKDGEDTGDNRALRAKIDRSMETLNRAIEEGDASLITARDRVHIERDLQQSLDDFARMMGMPNEFINNLPKTDFDYSGKTRDPSAREYLGAAYKDDGVRPETKPESAPKPESAIDFGKETNEGTYGLVTPFSYDGRKFEARRPNRMDSARYTVYEVGRDKGGDDTYTRLFEAKTKEEIGDKLPDVLAKREESQAKEAEAKTAKAAKDEAEYKRVYDKAYEEAIEDGRSEKNAKKIANEAVERAKGNRPSSGHVKTYRIGDASVGGYDMDVRSKTDAGGENLTAAEVVEKFITPAEGAGKSGLYPLEMPELVELARQIMGKSPEVRKVLRQGALGLARRAKIKEGKRIQLLADIFKDPELAARVLAHEIGHVDHEISGNLGAIIKNMKDLFRRYLEESPKHGPQFTAAEKRAARRTAERLLTDGTDEEIKAKYNEIKAKYDEILADEAKLRGLLDRKKIKQELWELSKAWRPFDESKASANDLKYRKKPEEIYADAVSVLLNDPDLLMQRAPTAFKVIKGWMENKPDMFEAYNKIQARYAEGREAVNEARLASDLRGMEKVEKQQENAAAEKEKERKSKSSFKRSWGKIREYILNRERALKTIERTLRKLGINISDEASAYMAASDHAYNKARILAYSIDVDQKVGAALGGWASKGWGSVDMGDGTRENLTAAEAFGEFLKLNREVTERAGIANKYDKKSAQELLDSLRKKVGEDNWKRILEAKKVFNNLRKTQIFPLIRESKAFSDAVVEKMENNEDYATFRVAFDNDNRESSVPNIKPVGIHAQKGNLLDIGNAFTATVSNDIYLMDFVSRNNYRMKAFSVLKQAADNGLPFKVEPAEKNSLGEVRDAGSGQEMETIYARENGKLVALNMDKELAAMIREQTPTTNWFWNAIKVLSSYWRPLVTTYSPPFQAVNIIRDNIGVAFNNKGVMGLRYIRNWFASMPEAWRFHDKEVMSDTIREMLQLGALNTGYKGGNRAHMGMEDIEKRIQDTFKNEPAQRRFFGKIYKEVSDVFGAIPHFMENISGTFEFSTKVAGYKTLTTRKKNPLTPLQSARTTRKSIGTPDALAKGTLTKYTNTIVAFSNIVIQSYEVAYNQIVKHPYRSIGLTAALGAASNIPAILARYNLLAPFMESIGMDNEAAGKLQDTYNDTVKYIKKKYILLPTGIEGKDEQKYAATVPTDPATTYIRGILYDAMDQGLGAYLAKADPKGYNSGKYTPKPYVRKDDGVDEDEYDAADEYDDADVDETVKASHLDAREFIGSVKDVNPFAEESMFPVFQIAAAWWTYLIDKENPSDPYRGFPIIPKDVDGAGFKHEAPYLLKFSFAKLAGGWPVDVVKDAMALVPRKADAVDEGEGEEDDEIPQTEPRKAADWVTELPIGGVIVRRLFRKVRGGYDEMERDAERKKRNATKRGRLEAKPDEDEDE